MYYKSRIKNVDDIISSKNIRIYVLRNERSLLSHVCVCVCVLSSRSTVKIYPLSRVLVGILLIQSGFPPPAVFTPTRRIDPNLSHAFHLSIIIV